MFPFPSIKAYHNSLASGTVTCVETVTYYLQQIRKNQQLNAFIEVFENEALEAAALLDAIFTDPTQALLAIASIGADMSDEERTESEKIIVASVIAGQAAVTAAGAAGAYRRKP